MRALLVEVPERNGDLGELGGEPCELRGRALQANVDKCWGRIGAAGGAEKVEKRASK